MKKCRYHVFYKGLKEPTCGCEKCEAKWASMSKKRTKKEITQDCPEPEECVEGCLGYCSEVEDLTEDVLDFMERNK